MGTKVGVWIDHKQAIVVLVTDKGKELKKIASNVGRPTRSASGARSRRKYTSNDFVAEDTLERRTENDRKVYFDEVIKSIGAATNVLIFGPGEAKGEFFKQIKGKKLYGGNVELETTDKLTDRQIVSKVGEHFTKVPARKSITPKKAAKALLGKRKRK